MVPLVLERLSLQKPLPMNPMPTLLPPKEVTCFPNGTVSLKRGLLRFLQRARQVAPSIVFLDELDSLAPIRGASAGEPQVTARILNQLLSEMDGLEELRGVVVIGATNRPDIIDPALIRPGRFDELILVPIPDEGARREIFKVHTEKMALAEDVDIEKLVSMTDQYTGADIAAVCKKAGRHALREDLHAKNVKQRHFLKAIAEIGSFSYSGYYEILRSDKRRAQDQEI